VLVAAMAGVCVLAAGTPALAGPATDRLRDFFGRVNGVLNDPTIQSEPLEKVARIKHLVTDIADVRGVAAAVLEREWIKGRRPSETSSRGCSRSCSIVAWWRGWPAR